MQGTRAEVISKVISTYRRKAKASIPELIELERAGRVAQRGLLLEHRSGVRSPALTRQLSFAPTSGGEEIKRPATLEDAIQQN